MGILLFELFRNPLFMGILNKWETLVNNVRCTREYKRKFDLSFAIPLVCSTFARKLAN